MEWQAQKIRQSLSEADPWRAITRGFPALRLVESEMAGRADADVPGLKKGLTKLYSKYVDEWERFSARRRFAPAA